MPRVGRLLHHMKKETPMKPYHFAAAVALTLVTLALAACGHGHGMGGY